MKLGIYIAGMGAEDIKPRLAQAREAGFSLCMVSLHRPGHTRHDLALLADDLVELGIRPLAIGCCVNPIRPDDAGFMGASAEDLDTLLHALDIVGARRVVLCSGTYSDSPADPHDRNGTPEALDALHAFVGDVLARTKARNFQLVFEPNPFHVLSSPERAIEFHSRLSDVERTHVRYVLDGASMILASNWEERNMLARAACEQLGEIAGIAYLRDAAIDETAGVVYPAPGEGGLDYPQYASAMVRHAGGAGAVIRSATPDRFADARDFMLRLGAWELA